MLFLAVTAEEKGLLGSRHYAQNPLYPATETVAALNMDGMNVWGRTTDITVVGLGQSELDDVAGEVAAEVGRVLRPDPEPEKGFYYRSDHFEFAKVGIPAFYPGRRGGLHRQAPRIRHGGAGHLRRRGVSQTGGRGGGLVRPLGDGG